LPVLALASALPMLAALPIASYSVPDYLKVAFWYPLACATVSLGLKSFFGAARRTIGPRMKKGGQERRVALAVMLMAAAIANPRPAIVGGKGILALFGSTSIAAEAGTRLSFPLARPAMAILVLGIFIALAAAAAVLEDIASREPRARLTSHTDGPGRRKRPVPIMVLVVDAERRIAPGLAVSLPLAMITVFQGAAPWIPLAFAAVAMSVRTGAALLFLATDGETARRFALIPAGPGTVDRAFLAAAVAASSLAAAPLVAAGLGLAIWS
jgi:hypothetical protein